MQERQDADFQMLDSVKNDSQEAFDVHQDQPVSLHRAIEFKKRFN